MAEFTCVLLYPDYYASNFGQETWIDAVAAETPAEALAAARAQCISEQAVTDAIEAPEDLYCIAMFPGRHTDVSTPAA